MSRDIPTTLSDNIENDVVKPFFALEMLFDNDETLRVWTGLGVLSYQGNDWYGTGDFLALNTVTETTEMSAEGAVVTLSGVPNEVLSLALTEPYQGRRAHIYFGLHLDGEVVSLLTMLETFYSTLWVKPTLVITGLTTRSLWLKSSLVSWTK